jgi:hypothetical protein
METDFKNISGMFRTNTDIISKAIADVRPEDWFRTPGDDSNHLMWLLGHVVVHRGHVLKTLGSDWNRSWASLFSRGSERVDEAEYPTVDEMRAGGTRSHSSSKRLCARRRLTYSQKTRRKVRHRSIRNSAAPLRSMLFTTLITPVRSASFVSGSATARRSVRKFLSGCRFPGLSRVVRLKAGTQ